VASSLQYLNSLSLARSSTTLTPACCFANSSVQFPVTERHFLAVVSFPSGRAPPARGQPTPDLLRLNQRSHQLPRDLLVLADPLILHRGQPVAGTFEPSHHPRQNHIIALKLSDPSLDPLVHHSAFPTLAGDLPRRRRLGLRRTPSILHVFIKLMARTRSSCLTGPRAQVVGRRSSPEQPRRRRPLRRHLGLRSNVTVPVVLVHDT
jgi:hypothetical protein